MNQELVEALSHEPAPEPGPETAPETALPGPIAATAPAEPEPMAELVPSRAPKRNAGWFRAADSRINRQGRPKGSKRATAQANPADLAPHAGRLMLLTLPAQDFLFRLQHRTAPLIANLPEDVEIVASRYCPAQNAVVLILHSRAFPMVAKGTPIPAFVPVKRPEGNARVIMPESYARRFLYTMYASVPDGSQIVGCTWDQNRKEAVWSIQSPYVPAVPEGKPLPEFRPWR